MNIWIDNAKRNYSHQCNYYQRAKKMNKKAVSNKSAPKKATLKKSVKKAPKKEAVIDPVVTHLQTSKCKTVSEKSELTYNISLDDEGQAVIRIASNTGGGFWSKEYVPLSKIVDVIETVPEDHSITSVNFFKLFVGKSQNTPGFLLAVLLKEGLLESTGKKRQYRMNKSGVDKFLAKIDKLKSSKS